MNVRQLIASWMLLVLIIACGWAQEPDSLMPNPPTTSNTTGQTTAGTTQTVPNQSTCATPPADVATKSDLEQMKSALENELANANHDEQLWQCRCQKTHYNDKPIVRRYREARQRKARCNRAIAGINKKISAMSRYIHQVVEKLHNDENAISNVASGVSDLTKEVYLTDAEGNVVKGKDGKPLSRVRNNDIRTQRMYSELYPVDKNGKEHDALGELRQHIDNVANDSGLLGWPIKNWVILLLIAVPLTYLLFIVLVARLGRS